MVTHQMQIVHHRSTSVLLCTNIPTGRGRMAISHFVLTLCVKNKLIKILHESIAVMIFLVFKLADLRIQRGYGGDSIQLKLSRILAPTKVQLSPTGRIYVYIHLINKL